MEARINRKNLLGKKARMSYTQILIIIISSFAFAYIVYSATEVSAQTTQGVQNYGCCEKTKDGNYCQFVQEQNCNSSFQKAPTECKYTDYCKLGCCFSSSTGWCNENTPKRSCQESNGIWKEDAACNIPECTRACCVLGNNAIWTTSKNCQVEAGFLGIGKDFRTEIKSEIECIFLAEKDDEGACVFEEEFTRTCKFTTRENCKNTNGDFYKNTFCSDSGLGTDCKVHDHFGCVKNKIGNDESVYWFDSCGNKEDVKEECSIFAGTVCGQVNGEVKCKSTDCIIAGKIRKNGESWCEYEGTIGNGRDVVGSRHVKHICFLGEERIEPCEDYRNQICVQSDTELENGKTFSEAACRINNWRFCLDYNTLENTEAREKKCKENPDCIIKHVGIDKFSFNFCAPNYPPGFDLTSEANGRDAELVCGMASQKCTVIYVKKISGWKCEVNCGCEKAGFTQQMNELCTSLGDCGGYVNIAGEYTDEGYSVSRSPRLSGNYLNSLKQYASYKPGQKAEPGNLSFLLGSFGNPSDPSYNPSSSFKNALGIGGVGFTLQVASLYFGPYGHSLPSAISTAMSGGGAHGMAPHATMGAFGDALIAVGSAMIAASILQMAFGIDYGTALVIAVASVVAYVAITTSTLTWTNVIAAFGKLFWPLLIVYAILKLLGIGKTKKKIVTFNCLPWQPPSGGANCGKCNSNDALGVPCSEYRCKSLGQACELINEGTGQETCVAINVNDVSSPRISPLLGTISEDYQYANIKDNGFEITDLHEECIPEFTNVIYGIKTDKPSQCKMGTDAMQSYDEMEEFFGGSNLYLTNHTSILNIPSPSAFANQYNLTAEQIKALGDIKFYIKCKSVNGVVNEASYTIRSCVKPGPDLTAPYITNTIPKNNAYISFNATQQNLQIWVNEPANCKWSREDRSYDNMETLMTCQIDLEDYELWGWPCNATLTNLETNTKFYIRCQDISENKNAMRQSYVYELKKSASELSIDEISPSGEIVAGTEPMTVNLEALTSGGAEQGKAMCSYSFDRNSYINFFDTYSDYHKQVFSSITRGSYKIYVKCEDVAGNSDENFTEFSVNIDTSAPIITRAYYDGSLKIMTNENSICDYSLNNCKFDMNNETEATLMSGEEKEHSADWQTDASYYIKCQDDYGNKPGGCSMIIRAYDII